MAIERSRRDFLKQASVVVGASGLGLGLGLERVWAADAPFVFAETAFGKIRGVDVRRKTSVSRGRG